MPRAARPAIPLAAVRALRCMGESRGCYVATPDGAELQGHAQPPENGISDEGEPHDSREPEILQTWEETRLYQQIQKAREGAELFVLHDGPPFANGDVHMGTALNKILKDLVVKSKTMLGFRAPYVPGWDCHGLPIEYKVVKETRGLSPLEVRQRCEEFARKFIDIQREQFKRLGVLGDWETAVSHARSRLRGGDPPRVRRLRGEGARLRDRRSRCFGAPARRRRWPRRRSNTTTARTPRSM